MQQLQQQMQAVQALMGTPGLSTEYKAKQVSHLKDLRVQILAELDAYGRTVSDRELPSYKQLRTATTSFLSSVDRFLELSLSGSRRRPEHSGLSLVQANRRLFAKP